MKLIKRVRNAVSRAKANIRKRRFNIFAKSNVFYGTPKKFNKRPFIFFKNQKLIGSIITEGNINIRITDKHPEYPLCYFYEIERRKS